MIQWGFSIDMVLYVVYTILVSVLLYFVYRARVNNKELFARYIQTELDKKLLGMEITTLQEEKALRELSESDGFVKFLSTSRDWAFDYIEEVQEALEEFNETVAPILKWTETYGSAVQDNVFRDRLLEISLAYEKLQSLLPKNNETPNN